MEGSKFAYKLGQLGQESHGFFTWDLLVKYVPKLPEVDVFLERDLLRHKAFFTELNFHRYLPPFLIITRKR